VQAAGHTKLRVITVSSFPAVRITAKRSEAVFILNLENVMNQIKNRIIGAIIVFALAIEGYSTASASVQSATSSQPVYAYSYLWWSTKHWQDKLGTNYPYGTSPLPLPSTTDADGCAPVSKYVGNQLLDVPAQLFSQDDPGVIESDIRTAKGAGVTGFWLNWIGNGSATQTLTSTSTYTKRLVEGFAASNRVGGFTNWVSYEASSMPTADAIINDLNFAYTQFGTDPAWQKIDGQPAVVFTGSRKYSDADVTKISNALSGKSYFVGDESYKTLTDARLALCDGVTYYWSSQDPYNNPASFDQIKQMGAKVHAAGKRWFAPFTPGFTTILLTGGTTCVPRKNGDTMRNLWNGNSASNPDGRILISWNEIGENSHVKPLQKWGSTYVNVLAQLISGSTTSPTPTPTTSSTTSKTYDDTNSGFTFSSTAWQSVSTIYAYNNSYRETTKEGSAVTFPFTGQSFSIIYKGGTTFSKFDVYVDGVLVTQLDQKASSATYQKRWDYPGQLAYGNHTLKLVFRVTSSTVYRGSLDAVIVR
jgi:hypothetical protein